MTDPRQISLAEMQTQLLVDISIEWLDRVDDDVAADQTEDELARVLHCDSCGFTLDRDWNAARNLGKIAASSAVPVCGGTRSGPARMSRVKPGSGKQKPDGIAAQFHAETASYA